MSDQRCIPTDGHCSVCGDEAIEVRVLEVDAATDTALVAAPAGEQRVGLDLVDDVREGSRLLVHLGFAIATLDGVGQGAGRARDDLRTEVTP